MRNDRSHTYSSTSLERHQIPVVRFDLLALSFLTILSSLRFFDSTTPLTIDTSYVFSIFRLFVCEILDTGTPPLWIADGTFGIPSTADILFTMCPFSFLIGFLGGIIGVEDTLFLFKLTILFSSIFFAIGLYYLFYELRFSRGTRLFLTVSAIGTLTVFPGEIHFGLRTFQFFPWLLLFGIRCSRTRNVSDALAIILLGLYSLHGAIPYLLVPTAYSLILFFGFIPNTPLSLFRGRWYWDRKCFLYILAIACIASGLVHSLYGFWDETVFVHPDRTTGTGDVSLSMYLLKSTEVGGLGMLRSLLFAVPSMNELYLPTTYYTGLSVLLLAFWAFFLKLGSWAYWGSIVSILFLVSLACGGLLSACAYLAPGFSTLRYLPHAISIVRIFLLIPAGFALDELYKQYLQSNIRVDLWKPIILFGLLLLLLGDFTGQEYILHFLLKSPLDMQGRIYLLFILRISLLLFFTFLLILPCKPWMKRFSFATPSTYFIVLVGSHLLLDVGSYQVSRHFVLRNYGLHESEVQSYTSLPQRDLHPRTQHSPEDHLRVDFSIAVSSLSNMDFIHPHKLNPFLDKSVYQYILSVKPHVAKEWGRLTFDEDTVASALGFHGKLVFIPDPNHDLSSYDIHSQTSRPRWLILDKDSILSMTSNMLSVGLPSTHKGGWLRYADSYSTKWQAFVKESQREVIIDSAGMKIIRVEQNDYEIDLVYKDIWRTSYYLAIFLSTLLFLPIWCFFCPPLTVYIDKTQSRIFHQHC